MTTASNDAAAPSNDADAGAGAKPPVATRVPHPTTMFGHTLTDDYSWLRDKDTPPVLDYLHAENAYTAAAMQSTVPFQEQLYKEMVSRTPEDIETPPFRLGAYMYFARITKGQQYPVTLRRKHTAKGASLAAEDVLIDPNAIAATLPGDHPFVSIASWKISEDGTKLAYLQDTVGFRQYVLHTRDLTTGKEGSEAIPRVDGMTFSRDGKTIYYVTEDEQTKRSDKLWRHTLGGDASQDELLYEEKDQLFNLRGFTSKSRRYFVVQSDSKTASEVRLLDLTAPASAAKPKLVLARRPDIELSVEDHGDLLYILANDKGRNNRLVTAKLSDPSPEHWTEVIPERHDVMLEGMEMFNSHLVLQVRENALPGLEVVELGTGHRRVLPQSDAVYDLSLDANMELDEPTVRAQYQSPTTLPMYVEYDLHTGARTVLSQQKAAGFDPTKYETARVMIKARDGVDVPVSLIYLKGTKPDASHPVFLYAYGSYGIPIVPGYSAARPSLLDRGMIYAHAHIRGGGDLGKRWHDAGRMETKMNSFNDFIDVGEGLKKLGWARPDGIVAEGGSAGGMLMGGIANMRPDLWKAVVALVPFVDVMNTMLDETLPLTVGEYEEWGNPHKEPDFDRMLSYSPYDNIKAQMYPSMLVRTSYHDSQVMYWEPAKYVARLRASKTDTNPLYFKINMDPSGHGGASGRYDRLKDNAFDYAFILTQVGIEK